MAMVVFVYPHVAPRTRNSNGVLLFAVHYFCDIVFNCLFLSKYDYFKENQCHVCILTHYC